MFQNAFWQDVADRAARQAYLILGPVLVVIAGHTGAGINYRATILAVLIGVAGTVILAVAGAALDPEAPLWQRIAERAAKAAAGALAGLLTTGGIGLLTVPWQSAFQAALAAAALSMITMFVSPPPRREDLTLAA